MNKSLSLFLIVFFISYSLAEEQNSAVKSSFSDSDSPLVDIIWCGEGKPSASIIVLTEKGTAYRSVNKGSTWLNMKPYFKTTAKSELDKGDKVSILCLISDWSHKTNC